MQLDPLLAAAATKEQYGANVSSTVVVAETISREAGDKQKGVRFQKLRAAIRLLKAIQNKTAGRVYCALEFLEDSVLLDGSASCILSGEENKLYSSALSFNSSAIKNTLVAFLDLKCTMPTGELLLGIYASAELADEKIAADVCLAVGLPHAGKMHSILKRLVAGTALNNVEQKIARYLALDEYRLQYQAKPGRGYLEIIEKWSPEKFSNFIDEIQWSIAVETNEDLEEEALTLIKSSRFFNYKHEGLEAYILAKVLDEFEKRSQEKIALDRLVATSDIELIYSRIISEVRFGESVSEKPEDPAGKTWSAISTSDQRSLEEKILAVSPSYPAKSLQLLARRCSLARIEASQFERDYVSLRRRLIDVCEEALQKIDCHVEPSVVDEILDNLSSRSFERLKDLSLSYRYSIKDSETTKGAVLTLFDDCFLAFDGP